MNKFYEELKTREENAKKELEFAQKRFSEITLLKTLYEEQLKGNK